MRWRATLDVPYTFAVETGTSTSRHCRDFHDSQRSLDTWIEPVTGTLMLKPLCMYEDPFTQETDRGRLWVDTLADFRHQAALWRETKRGVKPFNTSMIDKVVGRTNVTRLGRWREIEILVDVAILNILDSGLLWAKESLYTLNADEGITIEYQPLSDELVRKADWLAVQWDNIYLRFSQSGQAGAYMYDRANMLRAPKPFDLWQWCEPGQIAYSSGRIMLIPIPGCGLVVRHTSHNVGLGGLISSATGFKPLQGHLVPWPTRTMPDGTVRLFDPSRWRMAINPMQQYHLVTGTLAYRTDRQRSQPAYFMDGALDLAYAPQNPAQSYTKIVPTRLGKPKVPVDTIWAQAVMKDPTGDHPWEMGTSKIRACLELHTTDSSVTPMVRSYGVQFDPVWAIRDTAPWQPSGLERVTQIELTTTDDLHMEGSMKMLIGSDTGHALCERGDTTVVVEHSDDGVTWTPYMAGWAKQFELEYLGGGGGRQAWATVECKLSGMEERLREALCIQATAFDNMSLTDSITKVLHDAGFAPAVGGDAYYRSITIPASGQDNTWKYAVKLRDNGDDVIRKLLLMARRQHHEWIHVWDPISARWLVGQRARDTSVDGTWIATAEDDYWRVLLEAHPRAVRYSALKVTPKPPEFNNLILRGKSEDGQANGGGAAVKTAHAVNEESISGPASHPDYLGRMISRVVEVEETGDQGEMNLMCRRVFDRAAVHEIEAEMHVESFVPGFGPNMRVHVLLPGRGRDLELLWVKRSSLTVTGGGATGYTERCTHQLSSNWCGELPS